MQEPATADARQKWGGWLQQMQATGQLQAGRPQPDDELHALARAGVPHEMRPQLWPVLTGSGAKGAAGRQDPFGWGALVQAVRPDSLPRMLSLARSLALWPAARGEKTRRRGRRLGGRRVQVSRGQQAAASGMIDQTLPATTVAHAIFEVPTPRFSSLPGTHNRRARALRRPCRSGWA